MSNAAVCQYRHIEKPSNYYDQPDNPPKTAVVENIPLQVVDYTIFEHRLGTFENWPNDHVSGRSLAEAGFIYTGQDDIVQCPFCKIEGFRWVSGDNPMEDHSVWRPDCPFISSTIEHDHSESNRANLDTCGLYGIEILPNSVPEHSNIDLKKLGIHKNKGPIAEEYISYESRLASFKSWPKSLKQRPAALAEAGFYYSGVGDQTVCFYCGGGLKDWEANDDPWEQHALWFNTCVFLNLKKGLQYIREVKEKRDRELSLPSTSGAETKEEPQAEALKSEKCEKSNGQETEAAVKTVCKICYKNELGVVFLPCGHIVACVDCAAALKTCAVCRKPLEATVRAFIS